MFLGFLALLSIVSCTPMDTIPTKQVSRAVSASWSSRVLAPYVSLSPMPAFDIGTCMSQTGVKTYTLSSINGDAKGNPAWGGSDPITNTFYSDFINLIRSEGGDVIVSFGGGGGMTINFLNLRERVSSRFKQCIRFSCQVSVSY